MEGVKKFLDTDGVYGEAAPDDPTGVNNHYFKVIKVGRIGVAKISNQKKKFNLKKIETKYLLDPS